MDEDMVADLWKALDVILNYTERILIEDVYGSKFEVAGGRVVGSGTDDPGLVLKIKRLD